jgi:hypothetical protein
MIESDQTSGGAATSTFSYDAIGDRVGQPTNDGATTTTISYLVDDNNQTGFSQTLEETTTVGTSTPTTKTYTIGLDIVAQYDIANWAPNLAISNVWRHS